MYLFSVSVPLIMLKCFQTQSSIAKPEAENGELFSSDLQKIQTGSHRRFHSSHAYHKIKLSQGVSCSIGLYALGMLDVL
jgi:hypothetical protein